MARNALGQSVSSMLHLQELAERAVEVAGTAKRPETRGKRLALAGFWRADLAGQAKADLEAYYEQSRRLADRGACREACDLVEQPNGLQVCRHTGRPCDRERLEALAAAWGVVNQTSGGESLCLELD